MYICNKQSLDFKGWAPARSCPATAEIGWNWNHTQYVERVLRLILKQQTCPHLLLTVTLQPAETCPPQTNTNKDLKCWHEILWTLSLLKEKNIVYFLITMSGDKDRSNRTKMYKWFTRKIYVCVCVWTGMGNRNMFLNIEKKTVQKTVIEICPDMQGKHTEPSLTGLVTKFQIYRFFFMDTNYSVTYTQYIQHTDCMWIYICEVLHVLHPPIP